MKNPIKDIPIVDTTNPVAKIPYLKSFETLSLKDRLYTDGEQWKPLLKLKFKRGECVLSLDGCCVVFFKSILFKLLK